jgi:hypothetical protein
VFRRFNVNLNQWSSYSYGGERYNLGGNVNANFTLLNYWGGFFGVNPQFGGLSTSQLRGGPAMRRFGSASAWAGFFSDERKAVRIEVFGNGWRQPETGSWEASAGPYIAWRPSGNVDLAIGPQIAWNRDQTQYLQTEALASGTEYFFGHLHQTTVGMSFRANLTFSPVLSLQLYAEPFYSAGEYQSIRRVASPLATTFAEQYETLGPDKLTRSVDGDYLVDLDGDASSDVLIPNPDFSYASFRSNVVLRWEYRPGSTVFVVWQQNRGTSSTDGRYDPGDAATAMFRNEPQNVLMVKVNYWLSL